MDLGDLILNACKSRRQSLAAVCKVSGLRYSTLHSQISNKREIPFSSVDRIAKTLNLPLSYFSGDAPAMTFDPVSTSNKDQIETARLLSDLVNKQTSAKSIYNYQLSIDDMLDWLIANNSQLVNCKELIEWVNLYLPAKPGDLTPTPYRIGPKSLTSKYFGVFKIETYKEVLNTYDEDAQREIIEAHLECASKPYLITDKRINTVSNGVRIRGTYRRLLAPVKDVEGKKLTLGFSKLTHFPRT